jgi:hypothetical protein
MNGIYALSDFNCDVFTSHVTVVAGKTLKDCRLSSPKVFGRFDSSSSYLAMCCPRGSEYLLAFSREGLVPGVISHEVFHSTHLIMERRGVEYHIDHDEPFAILNEYLFNETWKIVGRHCK